MNWKTACKIVAPAAACAVNAGIDSIFVLSGEGKREDIERDSIHPTWVYDDIGAVLRAWEETP